MTNSNEDRKMQVETVKRTKFVDHIFKFFKLEEPVEKREYTKKEKTIYTIVLGLLVTLFITSLGGFVIVWFTNYYEASLQENLVLVNGSQAKTWWEKTPIYPLLKVHVFNYTNIEDFIDGKDQKLKVEDLGPLTYKEIAEKVDLQHHDDNTITYKEHRRYEFLPELSTTLKLYDEVTVPNIPFIIADRKISKLNFFSQFAPSTFIQNLSPKPKPFLTLPVTKFLWGYEDPIINSYNTLATFTGESVLFDRFGMIASRSGVSRDNYTIHSGIGDINQLGVFVKINGENKTDIYLDDECNKIDGTDGSQFPPHLMDKKSPLQVYINNICRKFPLVFEKEVSVFNGIPAWRYKNPDNVFSHPDKNPQNQCYCDSTCPPDGVFNMSKCAYGTPILASFPHFYLGDKNLANQFDGLNPSEEKHNTYADVHPRLAFPLGGVTRFQINVELNDKDNLAFISLAPFSKKYRILPVVWLEVTGGDIPDDFKELIYHSTHSVNAFLSTLRYATAICVFVTFSLMAFMYLLHIKRQNASKNIVENVKYGQGSVHI